MNCSLVQPTDAGLCCVVPCASLSGSLSRTRKSQVGGTAAKAAAKSGYCCGEGNVWPASREKRKANDDDDDGDVEGGMDIFAPNDANGGDDVLQCRHFLPLSNGFYSFGDDPSL